METSIVIDMDLDQLKQKLLTMASHAEIAVNEALRALMERDYELALRVKENDNVIDHLEVEIDEMAIHLLAKAPLASDLRLVTVAMKISQNLERVGDEACSIARRAHDLNAEQVAGLARAVGADKVEVVAYQHLPVFHTEHCVFCRFLSTGTSYRDCGRPCEVHSVALRDTAGRAHPVMADVGCRNTVFGAEVQEAGAHLEDWRAAGIARYRLEFAHESAAQVTGVTRAFADALAGRISARDLTQRLQKLTPEGVTQGSFFIPENYLTLPVLQ